VQLLCWLAFCLFAHVCQVDSWGMQGVSLVLLAGSMLSLLLGLTYWLDCCLLFSTLDCQVVFWGCFPYVLCLLLVGPYWSGSLWSLGFAALAAGCCQGLLLVYCWFAPGLCFALVVGACSPNLFLFLGACSPFCLFCFVDPCLSAWLGC
jgi:hypothetical protein